MLKGAQHLGSSLLIWRRSPHPPRDRHPERREGISARGEASQRYGVAVGTSIRLGRRS